MKTLSIVFTAFLLLPGLLPIAQAQETVPPDKNQLLKVDPMGQTLIADSNKYPSPEKILTFKDQLGLTKDQIKKIEEMMNNLPISITVKGQEIVEAEEDLAKSFESGAINEKTLRMKLERIGKLRADLRFTHLQVYLKAKQILSRNQWDRLMELVGSESK